MISSFYTLHPKIAVSRLTIDVFRLLSLVIRLFPLSFVLRLTLCALLLTLALPRLAVAQDNISFTASVDKTSLSTDQTLTLQLTLSGAFQNNGEPQFPPLNGLSVAGSSRSSQISFINGQVSSQVVFTYRLRPTQSGSLTIPAITIQVGKQTYQTQPINLTVTQGAPPPAQQPTSPAPQNAPTPAGALAGQSLYVEADVDNPKPVVGQQIIYRFRLYQTVNLFNQPSLDWPDFAGFLSYDLSPNKQYYQQAAGQQYLVTEVRRALFPTAAGAVTLAPAQLTIPGDFFNKTVRLQTQAVNVDVQPLPEGAPAGFAGAVGQFEISAEVEPTQTRVNEPVTLRVRVSGSGNINNLPDPTENAAATLSSWRVYDPQIETSMNQEGEAVQGERRFERPLVPKTDGDLTIPSFELVFFDPASGQYRQVETGPLTVRVQPGEAAAPGPVVINGDKQDLVVLGSDIRHIKPAPPALTSQHNGLLAQPLYWAGWGLPLLATLGMWAWERRRSHLESNVAYARALRAKRVAHKRLAQAYRLSQTDADAAYTAVAAALSDYLGDKLNLSGAGLTRDLIQQQLNTRGVSQDATQQLLACLDWADSGRFAPVAGGRSAAELVQEAESLIAQLEADL